MGIGRRAMGIGRRAMGFGLGAWGFVLCLMPSGPNVPLLFGFCARWALDLGFGRGAPASV